MKRLRRAAMGLVLLAGPAGADPVDGVWKTAADAGGGYGHVTMAACGPQVCGTLTQGFDKDGKPESGGAVGKQIVTGMTAKGSGVYAGGTVFVPAKGESYDPKMTLKGDQLDLSVCTALGCRDQVWTRVK